VAGGAGKALKDSRAAFIDPHELRFLYGLELRGFSECCAFMEDAKKVLAAAVVFVERHGEQAPEIARQWAKDLIEREDPAAAAVCLEIAGAATALLVKGAGCQAPEPPKLPDILSGAVTKEVMRADRVKPTDVERLMKKAKRHRSPDDG
jgi:hypothetical protein